MATTFKLNKPLLIVCEMCKDTGRNPLTNNGYCNCHIGNLIKDEENKGGK